jgi:hypothetical protein
MPYDNRKKKFQKKQNPHAQFHPRYPNNVLFSIQTAPEITVNLRYFPMGVSAEDPQPNHNNSNQTNDKLNSKAFFFSRFLQFPASHITEDEKDISDNINNSKLDVRLR